MSNVFRSAIVGDDGHVDAGYLSLFWTMVVVLNAIPFMCCASLLAMYFDPAHKFDVQGLGVGIGAVCTGFGVAIGAVGAFRMGDKPRPGTSQTTTVAQQTTETK